MTETAKQSALTGREELAADIALGLEQTAFCMLTDGFTDPYIAHKIQGKLSPHPSDHHDHGHAHVHSDKKNLAHNMIAEYTGDGIGLVAFVVLASIFRPVFHAARDGIKSLFDPFYETLGRKQLHFAPDEPLNDEQTHKLEALKRFHADTFVKSNALTLTSTLANAGVMKAIKSPHSWGVLLISKFAAAMVTTGFIIGLRFLFPQTLRKFDHGVAKYAVDPVVNATQKLMGLKPKPSQQSSAEETYPPSERWSQRVNHRIPQEQQRQ